MRIEWSPAARASARRFMEDQDGMRAIGAPVAGLVLASAAPMKAFRYLPLSPSIRDFPASYIRSCC